MTHDKNNIFQILFFLLCNCESFTFVLEVSFALFAVFNLWGLQWCEVINGSAPPLSGCHEMVNIRLLCFTPRTHIPQPHEHPSEKSWTKKHHTRRVQRGQAGSGLHRLCLAVALLHLSVLSLHKGLTRTWDERQIQKRVSSRKKTTKTYNKKANTVKRTGCNNASTADLEKCCICQQLIPS